MKGDSGGPLSIPMPDNSFVLGGASSFGYYACGPQPRVFGSLDNQAVVDWIKRTAGGEC